MFYVIDKDCAGKASYSSDITHIVIWDDVAEQIEAIRKLLKRVDPDSLRIQIPAEYSWAGRTDFTSWPEVLRLVDKPWEEGNRIVDGMLYQLQGIDLPVPRSIRRRCTWRQDDGDFDLDRFVDGKDSFRGTLKRDMTGQQFITLAVHIGANGDTSAQCILWRGAIAVAMAKILEDQGYSVEIMGYDMGSGVFRSGHSLMSCTWIKRFEHPFDISAVINGLSGWYFRIINWASYYCVKDQKVSYGFGRETVASERILEIATGNPEAWQIRNVWSKEAAVGLARHYLERLVDHDTVDELEEDCEPVTYGEL